MRILYSDDYVPDTEMMDILQRAATACVANEGMEPDNAEISLSFVTKEEIRSLNKMYRNIDRITDVLSFPLIEDFEKIDSDDIAFRPEIIQISDKPIESENCYQMKGHISVSLPHGNILRYAVDCGGEQVDVDVLFTGTVPFETHTDVYLSMKKDQCIYL